MAIILFQRGTGNSQKFNEFGFEHLLENGWCLTKEEALKPKEPEPVKIKDDEESIRQQAKEAGISHYWNKSIDTLKQELSDDNES